ncbi:MAG: tRNA pseudouridine(38-40) synthase TruA [Bacillaceae bacterium]|nr:tRNA pseudouridine(38-40) synthase TruA [Bacillaceae bacterium]
MERIKAIISYDGTNFSGYQVQPEKRTVQGVLEKALSQMHKVEEWKVIGSGRTDTGVHSYGQTIHFDTPLKIPVARWPNALNSLLPNDVHVSHATYVDNNFHARYDTVGKEYIYQVYTAKEKDIFRRNYAYHYPYELNDEEMFIAAEALIGTFDFTSFSSPRTSVVDKVRTIYHVDVKRVGDNLTFRYVGSGFLYQMVRILTGTLLHVGLGKISHSSIPTIIEEKDRNLAGPTIPGNGLYLSRVFYRNADLEKALNNHRKA